MLYVAANLRKIETYKGQMDQRGELEARKRARRRRVTLTEFMPR
jgi:hypothetical protein